MALTYHRKGERLAKKTLAAQDKKSGGVPILKREEKKK